MKNFITQKLFRLITAFMIGCLLIGTSGCDKEDPIPASPEISISAPGLTISNGVLNVAVTEDSIVTISYSVDALGIISSLEQAVDGVSETISSAEGDDAYTKQLVVNIPYENTTIEVEVKVTDEHEQSATASVTIQVEAIVPPATPMTESQLVIMGGNTSPSEPSRWDWDAGAGYTGWALKNTDQDKLETIDTFYTNLTLSDTDGGMLGDGTGAFVLKTDLTANDFESMEDDALLKDLVIDQTSVEIETGDVIAFVTNLGTKGVMLVGEYYSSTDDIDVKFKVQAK